MSGFDTVLTIDWSAGKRAPARPSKDAIWIGIARGGEAEDPLYCRSRQEAEAQLCALFDAEAAAGRRVLAGFDFPFGYPRGFARRITGQDDPRALWAWLSERITDAADGSNNRFEIAEEMNARFERPGPFWGKTHPDRWPGIPYRKHGIRYDEISERRICDAEARAASSCFQLAFPPTVGGQMLMGLPMLHRLAGRSGLAVWPFDPWQEAAVVLVEIWPGLIEPAVRAALAEAPDDAIRDAVQVTLLSRAISRLPGETLHRMMAEIPAEAGEEAWILGTGHEQTLCALAAPILAPPPLRNDCFALPPGVDWTPVDTALSRLRARLSAVTGIEEVPLSAAAGRVLAKDIHAARANPPEANTAVDGFGFAGDAVSDGDQILPLVSGRAAAGAPFDDPVPPGMAIRVLTGAALPQGVDTVVLDEDCTRGAGQVAFRGPVKPGANTRSAGEDVAAGALALRAGRVLTPADLALASAVGAGRLAVRERLRVAVLSTGDELRPPGAVAGRGQIFDANRPMLLAMIDRFGFAPVDMGIVPDDRAALCDALDEAARRAHLVLTSGGASAGDEDHVSALLREAGAMQEWRVALKPGRPLALGLWQGAPVFGLPGNPVAAFVCTLVFVRPALAVLAGADWFEPQGFDVPAAFAKRKKPGRREYLRARLREGRAEVFASEGSGRVSGLSWAEGLVELPDGAAEITPGTPVRYIPFGAFGLG